MKTGSGKRKGTGQSVAREERRAFEEGIDFYFENGLMVLTAEFLLKRGYCCGNGCRHCPYEEGDALSSE